MSDLQKEIVGFAHGIFQEPSVNVEEVKTVFQGATFVRQQLQNYLAKHQQESKK